MAGTWLDRVLRFQSCGCLRKDPIVFDLIGKGRGGRHWTRTSDLLHVKQARRAHSPGLTSAETIRRLYLQANGWTLAGRR